MSTKKAASEAAQPPLAPLAAEVADVVEEKENEHEKGDEENECKESLKSQLAEDDQLGSPIKAPIKPPSETAVAPSSRSSSPMSYSAPLSPKKLNSIEDYDEEDAENENEEAAYRSKEPLKTGADGASEAEFVEPQLPPPPAPAVANTRLQDESFNVSISSTKAELSSFVDDANDTTLNAVNAGAGFNFDEQATPAPVDVTVNTDANLLG